MGPPPGLDALLAISCGGDIHHVHVQQGRIQGSRPQCLLRLSRFIDSFASIILLVCSDYAWDLYTIPSIYRQYSSRSLIHFIHSTSASAPDGQSILQDGTHASPALSLPSWISIYAIGARHTALVDCPLAGTCLPLAYMRVSSSSASRVVHKYNPGTIWVVLVPVLEGGYTRE